MKQNPELPVFPGPFSPPVQPAVGSLWRLHRILLLPSGAVVRGPFPTLALILTEEKEKRLLATPLTEDAMAAVETDLILPPRSGWSGRAVLRASAWIPSWALESSLPGDPVSLSPSVLDCALGAAEGASPEGPVEGGGALPEWEGHRRLVVQMKKEWAYLDKAMRKWAELPSERIVPFCPPRPAGVFPLADASRTIDEISKVVLDEGRLVLALVHDEDGWGLEMDQSGDDPMPRVHINGRPVSFQGKDPARAHLGISRTPGMHVWIQGRSGGWMAWW